MKLESDRDTKRVRIVDFVELSFVGDEPPESLFMKELKRRGMTPTSLLQDYEVDVDEIKTGKESGSSSSSKTTATTPAFDQSLLNQRERSLALNSEGLEVRLILSHLQSLSS